MNAQEGRKEREDDAGSYEHDEEEEGGVVGLCAEREVRAVHLQEHLVRQGRLTHAPALHRTDTDARTQLVVEAAERRERHGNKVIFQSLNDE